MRQLTAGDIKRMSRNSSAKYRTEPRDGTRTRAVFDLFKSRPDDIVSMEEIKTAYRPNRVGDIPCIVIRLRDFYGLDIENLGRSGRRFLGYRLVGEWMTGGGYERYL